MNVELLSKVADDIEARTLGRFSMLTYDYDISAYILRASGVKDAQLGPLFHPAMKAAELPDDRLLWVGGWAEKWKKLWIEAWDAGEELRASVAAAMLREVIAEGTNDAGGAGQLEDRTPEVCSLPSGSGGADEADAA